ncbi:DNA polymerase III subunit delta [Acinetobacter larvae]|uniref:DNA polymerase III subunit delta n=1 Tax=Acinetobacter larvae TaxID=1789224 RepID=A0A1B2M209_9GAMM|nr:DNA polymerase III subunit delta [Acinetobacter larvae]AOA59222.1 DNA polymerase III subunit delta [Acinetobacter larvae]
MKIDYLQALKRIHAARGVWLMQGQEPLLEQNLLQAFRKDWQQHNVERQRFDLNSVADWKTVFNALNSLSLFSQQLAIEVHGNIKPDAASLKLLKQYIQHNEHNLLLIVMPKQDSNSLKSSFFQTVEANGTLVNLIANSARDRQNILNIEAQALGIQLTYNAWQWLEQHHEHNLLAAKNSLMRVADTFPEQQQIEIEHLQQCLQDQSRYSSFDLSDAVLRGDLAQATKILQYLQQSGEAASLILWTLSKEMRLLMQLYEQPQNAIQLGIWRNKVAMYQHALARLSAQQFLTWPSLLLRVDAAIKGMRAENPQLLLQQCVAELCGRPLWH